MGFRQASGTKPSQLQNPVPQPKASNFDPNAAVANLRPSPTPAPGGMSVPGAPVPSPTPTPSPTPDMSALDEIVPINDPAALDEVVPGEAAAAVPEDFMGRFKNEDVEGHLLGLKVKAGKDGTILVKSPLGKDEWKPPTEAQAEAARLVYFTVRDAGTNLGAIGGEVAGAVGGALTTAGTMSIPAAMALGAAGGAAGSKFNQDILNKITSTEGGAKFLHLLKRVGGVEDGEDEVPMGTAGSAALGAISPLAGALMGSMAKRGGKAIAGAEKEMASTLFDSTSKPVLDDLAAASAETGVPVSAAEGMANLPGGGKAKKALADASGGVFGDDIKSIYEAQSLEKQNKLKNYVQGMIQRVAPGVDFSKPSQIMVGQSEKAGFKDMNLVDKFIDNFGRVLGDYTADASKKAGAKQFDIEPLYQNALSLVKETGASDLAAALEKGDVAKANELLKTQHSEDRDLRGLVNQVFQIRNQRNRSSILARQEGISTVPQASELGVNGSVLPENSGLVNASKSSGEATAGATYDWMNSYVNNLQRLSKDNPLLQRLAGSARSNEAEILQKIYADNPSMVREIQAANEVYSKSIDQLKSLSKAVTSGEANIGGAVLNWDAPTIRMLKSVMSKDELSQFRGASLNAAFKDQLILNPVEGLSPETIKKTFFSGTKEEAMTELLGGETMDRLKKVVTIAQFLEKPGVKASTADGAMREASKEMIGLAKGLGGWDYARKVGGAIFGHNKEALDMINTNIDNYAKFMPTSKSGPVRSAVGSKLESAAPMIETGTRRVGKASNLLYNTYQDSRD